MVNSTLTPVAQNSLGFSILQARPCQRFEASVSRPIICGNRKIRESSGNGGKISTIGADRLNSRPSNPAGPPTGQYRHIICRIQWTFSRLFARQARVRSAINPRISHRTIRSSRLSGRLWNPFTLQKTSIVVALFPFKTVARLPPAH
jgi:hypothetical protein